MYVYVIVTSVGHVAYLRRKDPFFLYPYVDDHPYNKEVWTTTAKASLAFQGKSKNPPRAKYGDSNVLSIQVDRLEDFLAMNKVIHI